jgi:succinoglycan biosynthesis protein ExoA
MEAKTVSIIIPVKPGGKVRALEALRNVEYPSNAVEIIVVEGKCPSRQRNMAAATAGGEILYFLDDDSMVLPQFLQRSVSHYRNNSVAAVGGPSLTPESDTPLQQAFGMVLSSRFGSGGVRNRYRKNGHVRETGDEELILCNLSISSQVFRAFNGFDERLYPNEENELMVRMRKKGLVLVHDPNLAVYRSQRRTLAAFVRQIFGYGMGRGRQTLLGGVSSYGSFVPVAFLLYLLSLFLVVKPVYYLPLLCYLVMDLLWAVAASFGVGRLRLAPLLFFLFPILHLSYGAGILRGILPYPVRRGMLEDCQVTLRRVKEFDEVFSWT